MTEKIWKNADCGCVLWMDDNPEDQTQIATFRFDQSKCITFANNNIRQLTPKEIEIYNDAMKNGYSASDAIDKYRQLTPKDIQ